jgi:hypothetical protein
MSDLIGIIAAVSSAVAAVAAAIATYYGPRSAARLAEDIRQRSDRDAEIARLKRHVFTTLMQERAAYYTTEAVRAFNLIDVVFSENRTVRECWADFLSSLDSVRNVPDHAKDEKFQRLLIEMSKDIGLSSDLRSDDIKRSYYPTALVEEHRLKSLQRQSALAQLTNSNSPESNTAPNVDYANLFPPSPAEIKRMEQAD